MGVQAAATQAHRISDRNLTATTALAAAGSSVTSTAFDTGDNTDGFFPEGLELHLTVPSTANLVSTATLVYTVYADTANPPTTALSPSLTFTTTGTAGNGAAVDVRWRIPGNTGRYLAVNANSGTSGGGNNTGTSFTVKIEGAGTPA
jgi:hypothetical protein